jgi:hypothetical protein
MPRTLIVPVILGVCLCLAGCGSSAPEPDKSMSGKALEVKPAPMVPPAPSFPTPKN